MRVRLELDGLRTAYEVHLVGDRAHVDGPGGSSSFTEQPRFAQPGAQLAPGSLTASMPGTVSAVEVAEGDPVEAGQLLLVLEAMKMEHPVTAPVTGTVTALHAAVGQQVETGAVLAVVAAG